MRTAPATLAIASLLALISLVSSSAIAQTQDESNWCANNDNAYSDDGDLIIRGCTAIIRAGSWPGGTLAEAFHQRGRAYADTNKYELAISDYSAAIRLNPALRSGAVFSNRGQANEMLGDYDQAIVDYTEWIKLGRSLAWWYVGYTQRAAAHYEKGNYDGAIADLTKVIGADPSTGSYYESRGDAYIAKRAYADAIRDYGEAIKRTPNMSYRIHRNRGLAHLSMGDYVQAISDFTEAAQHAATLVAANTVYLGRGNAYFAKRDYDRAISDYTQEISQRPKNALAYYRRSLAYEAKANTVQAGADRREQERLDPSLSKAIELARETLLAGDIIAVYDEAIKLRPSSAGS